MTVIVVLYFIAFKVNSMVVDYIEFCILSSLNFTLTYALTIYFPMGRMVQFGYFFFSCGGFENDFDQGDISTKFIRVLFSGISL